MAAATVVVAAVEMAEAVAAETVAVAAEGASTVGAQRAKAMVATGPVKMTVENPGTEAGNRTLTVAGRTTPQK